MTPEAGNPWAPPDPAQRDRPAPTSASTTEPGHWNGRGLGWDRPRLAPPREAHGSLPMVAGVGAVLVLATSLVLSKYALDALVGFEWPIFVYVVVLSALGYGPSIVWVVYAVRRWGSGAFVADIGLRPRWSDLGWGPVIWLSAIGCQIAVAMVVLALDIPLSNNTDSVSELQADRSYVIAIVVSAVVVAPIVEEIVFRGVVMRSLLSIAHPSAAIAVQAILFGVAHVDPVRGVGNIGLAMVLSGVGVAFGGGAYFTRRIGPCIVAHAIFNGVVMILVLTGAVERAQ